MIFSNMVENGTKEYIRNKGKSFPLVVTEDKILNCSIFEKEGKIYIGESSEPNMFDIQGNTDDIFSETYRLRKRRTRNDDGTYRSYNEKVPEVSLTYGQVSDTAENPLIVVSTTGVKFYDNIPTYLKVLFVDNNVMIAMLVYGACEFRLGDSFVPLERCCTSNSDNKELSKEYTPANLSELVNIKTEMGTDLKFDSVCPIQVKFSSRSGFSLKIMKDSVVGFNRESIAKYEEGIIRKREERRTLIKAKEEKERLDRVKRVQEITGVLEEEKEQKHIEEMAKKEAELRIKEEIKQKRKKEKEQLKAKKPTKKKETARISAADFLDIVNNLK